MGTNEYAYAYDPIGNRTAATNDGVASAYTANALNQYTCITNSAYSASPRETIPAYDLDGNMLTNGVWAYTWDAENRMASAVSNGVLMVTNVYDHMSRRIRKVSRGGAETAEFLYDGWNVIRDVRSQSSEISTNYYTWGLDLSGTLQGAGGVGGLLSVTTVSSESAQPATYYPAYDANGNIVQYFDSTGGVARAFCYDAFGNAISESVQEGLHLPIRFSTKYLDPETGLYYYGWRFYHPELGRWVSRDPIGERGGRNQYLAWQNNGLLMVDFLGMTSVISSPWTVTDKATEMVDGTPSQNNLYCEGSVIGKIEVKVGIDASLTANIPGVTAGPPPKIGAPDHRHPSYLGVRIVVTVEITDQNGFKRCCGCDKPEIAWRQEKHNPKEVPEKWTRDDENGAFYWYEVGNTFIDEPGGNGEAVPNGAPRKVPEDRDYRAFLHCRNNPTPEIQRGRNEKVIAALMWGFKWKNVGRVHTAEMYWMW